MLTRRRFIASSAVGLAFGSAGVVPRALAQVVKKNARLMVGFPPGGSADAVARMLIEQMNGYASSMIVDNRPGAGGRMALDALKGSEPDGSVLVLSPAGMLVIFPHIYKQLSYKPLQDFVPVTTICSFPFQLTIGPMVPAYVKTLADFIDWCRANPKLATYGTPGAGSLPHFIGVMLARAAGFEFVHLAYKGGAPAMQDLLGGHIAASILPNAATLPLIESGNIRALATTGPQRSSRLPDVPTMKEAGYPALEAVEWFGVFVPANTTSEVVDALYTAIRQALKTDAVQAGLAKLSLEIAVTAPSEFARLVKSDTEHWGNIVKTSGFKPID